MVVTESQQPLAGMGFMDPYRVRDAFEHIGKWPASQGNNHWKDWKPKLRHQHAQWHWKKDRRSQFQQHQGKNQDGFWQKQHKSQHFPTHPHRVFGDTLPPKNLHDNSKDAGAMHRKEQESSLQKQHSPQQFPTSSEVGTTLPAENLCDSSTDVSTMQKKNQECLWQGQHAPQQPPICSEGGSGDAIPAQIVYDCPNDAGTTAGQELLALIQKETAQHDNLSLESQLYYACQQDGILGELPVSSFADVVAEGSEENSYGLSEAEMPPELWALLIGDETFQGEDGELYDVFYPDDAARSAKVLFPDGSSEKLLQNNGTDDRMLLPSTKKLNRASSAEDCLENLLQEMHLGVLERHPAKQHLFAAVHTAAQTALGSAFARLALVGSTAMQIDTPTSDLDVVVFTRPKDDSPQGVDALRWIAAALRGVEPSLRLELLDCAKVPILVATTVDGNLSIDVSVDQPLAELHVLWFQMQHEELPCQGPLHHVPAPAATSEWGQHAALCRVLKWWLNRRGIPGAKEGGYPSLVWLLMAMHSLRCSLFVDQADAAAGPHGLRHLLGALAAFFDRFSRPSGFWGAIVFADGMHSEFWLHRKAIEGGEPSKDGGQAGANQELSGDCQQSLPVFADFAVFDPARPEPADLAVRMSPATWLLFAFELRRAAHLAALALSSISNQSGKPEGGGRAALRELFFQVGTTKVNSLPVVLSEEASSGTESSQPLAGIFLTGGDGGEPSRLNVGIVSAIEPNSGWSAPFLHRRDVYSRVHVNFCDRYGEVLCVPHEEAQVVKPSDFVCGVQLRSLNGTGKVFEIAECDVERLVGMSALLAEEKS